MRLMLFKIPCFSWTAQLSYHQHTIVKVLGEFVTQLPCSNEANYFQEFFAARPAIEYKVSSVYCAYDSE